MILKESTRHTPIHKPSCVHNFIHPVHFLVTLRKKKASFSKRTISYASAIFKHSERQVQISKAAKKKKKMAIITRAMIMLPLLFLNIQTDWYRLLKQQQQKVAIITHIRCNCAKEKENNNKDDKEQKQFKQHRWQTRSFTVYLRCTQPGWAHFLGNMLASNDCLHGDYTFCQQVLQVKTATFPLHNHDCLEIIHFVNRCCR